MLKSFSELKKIDIIIIKDTKKRVNRFSKLILNKNLLKEKYIEDIYTINLIFDKRSSWWYTPLSSREWYNSEIQKKYQYYATIFEYISQNISQEFSLPVSSTFEYRIISGLCRILGYKIKYTGLGYFSLFSIDIILTLKNIKSIFTLVFLFFKLCLRSIKNKGNKDNCDVLFICPLHGQDVRLVNDNFFDRYFGELPHQFTKLNYNVFILGLADNLDYTSVVFKKEKLQVTFLLRYLKYKDLFKLIYCTIKEFLFPPSLPANLKFEIFGLNAQINQELKKYYRNRVLAKAYEFAFGNFIKFHRPKLVIHTFENNWWERSIDKVCNNSKNIIQKNIGFLHCSILESHLKYTLWKDEWNLKPSPDKILVTGPVAKDILIKRGNYPVNKIIIGYDLRGPNLYQIPQRNIISAEMKNILILLEGLNTMPNLLKLILNSLGDLNFNLSVRCHPVYPIDKPEFSEIRNHKYYNQLQITENTSLQEDLQSADLVIYKGSTSALYAAYMGIPLIRFQDEWWASDDPLHNCNYLKKEFSTSEELLEGIQYFKDMDQQVFNEQKEKLQEYVFQYMQPYKDDELKKLAQELIS
ncbi:MAG: hypothetical protein MH321_13670 [Leptospiraceae bacterium]|nr:hypothetical protein [Leptospiraceae bacterium]